MLLEKSANKVDEKGEEEEELRLLKSHNLSTCISCDPSLQKLYGADSEIWQTAAIDNKRQLLSNITIHIITANN